jgi:hypothetical protein
MNSEQPPDLNLKSEQTNPLPPETPALWVEAHLRIFDPETNQQIVNTRA